MFLLLWHLYPNFENVIEEDLETYIGGGYDGTGNIDSENHNKFRGLHVFGGLTYTLSLDINGDVYNRNTPLIRPFGSFTPTVDCTRLTSSETNGTLTAQEKTERLKLLKSLLAETEALMNQLENR